MTSLSDAASIYEAAHRWMEGCVAGDGSMLDPERRLWTAENLELLRRALEAHPITGPQAIRQNFAPQLGERAPQVIQLAAESLWVLFLFPGPRFEPALKRDYIQTVWGFSGRGSPPAESLLRDPVLRGVESPYAPFNARRDWEIGGLASIVAALKPVGGRLSSMSSWEVAALIDRIREKPAQLVRNVVLHLLFPTDFQPIASPTHKRQIVQAFEEAPGPKPLDLDQQLLRIRRSHRARRRTGRRLPGRRVPGRPHRPAAPLRTSRRPIPPRAATHRRRRSMPTRRRWAGFASRISWRVRPSWPSRRRICSTPPSC
jgi:5-methylcytosine-specific restriction enzyme B